MKYFNHEMNIHEANNTMYLKKQEDHYWYQSVQMGQPQVAPIRILAPLEVK
jgi:hypothetical protein